ncbi:MAG: methionyl-tRNA formyltransferase [Clostridiaceae bacterium]|jgi:methionyl-tRNA formyltransferase|nr:methionyl-tRNA formyltransferase [Clostridiaceae bacterium]
MIRYAFFGTPEFGRTILECLDQRGYHPSLVVTQPDRPKGRGRRLAAPPVAEWAAEHGVPFLQPIKGNDPELRRVMRELSPDVAVTAAYGQLISEEILSIPKHGFLNVHPSLLPLYRGASPVQSAILNGDQKTGVTIMLMDSGLDTGPLIASSEIPICDEMNADSLMAALSLKGGELAADTLEDWVTGRLQAVPQDESHATMTRRLSKEDGHINFALSANEVHNRIRAMFPWPGAYAYLNGVRVKILASRVARDIDEQERDDGSSDSKLYIVKSETSDVELYPGTIVIFTRTRLLVKCGTGWIELLKIQMPSRSPVYAHEVAHNIDKGSRFNLPKSEKC